MMRFLFGLLVIAATAIGQSPVPAAPAKKGFVATVNAYATDAGLAALERGGNAVDAAIAAAVTLGVVDSHNSGIGGGLFMVIRKPDGTFVALDGRETAPAAATRDMYHRDGKADPRLSQEGALAAGVPGWLAALGQAARDFGKLPVREHFERAAKLAEDGFVPDRGFAARRKRLEKTLQRHPETAKNLLQPIEDGRIRFADLATTYRAIAKGGAEWFYRGPFATETEKWMKANGGIMTAADFAAYAPKVRTPVRTTYRGYDIVGFPPPSSGGVHVAQILNILEAFDLRAMGDGSADFIHVVAEAMKLAFADRAHWLGDPDFVEVPRGLVEKAYSKALAERVDRERAIAVPTHGVPPDAGIFEKHTTHFSVADAEGWWVGCTATINTTWGSYVTIPGTGVILNNEMDDFSIEPGVPNAFGLVGAENNAVSPGKRPLSSMSPTIVSKDGRPVLVVGAAGGPTIITQVLLAIVRTVDFELPPSEAITRPRFHQQWKPDTLRIERAVPEAVREELQRRGHRLDVIGEIGVSQAVGTSGAGFTGASDPRISGKAAGR